MSCTIYPRKVFVATAAAGIGCLYAIPVAAAEWEINLGGYFEQHIGYTSLDAATASGVDEGAVALYDGELEIRPSITLDNGIRFSATVDLEAGRAGDDGSSNRIDEAFGQISGSFGDILFGTQDSAGSRMHVSAPNVALLGVNEGGPSGSEVPQAVQILGYDKGVWRGDDYYGGTLGSTYIETDRTDSARRITYFTPRFAGFQLGVSYAGEGRVPNPSTEDLFDIGVSYAGSFGDFGINLSGRWGTSSDSEGGPNDPEIWGAGINLGYAGVTIGGSWAESKESIDGYNDGSAFDIGISYATGPWSFSFTHFEGDSIDREHPAAFRLGEDLSLNVLGANYELAKGVSPIAFDVVTIGFYVADVDFNEQVGDGGFGNPGDDVDGFIIGTGIRLEF